MLGSLLLLGCVGTALAADGYVKLDFEREYVREIRKREIPAENLDENVTLAQRRSLYWLDLSIGTPAQPFRLQLDTGSSNLWVPNSALSECNLKGGCPGGSYTPGSSDTYSLVQEGTFEINYGDGTGDLGDYFTDVVTVGETTVKEGLLSIGLANQLKDGPSLVNDGQGLVGVGYQANLAGLNTLITADYIPPTLVQAMVTSGDIERESYSLWLDSQEDGVGAIIFGGVDSTKYTGELTALQVLPEPNRYSNFTAFNVALTGISIADESGTRLLTQPDFAIAALLDSGTTISYLPSSVFQKISTGFGVTQGYVPCHYSNANVALIYHFGGEGGPSIRVPLKAMIDVAAATQAEASYFDDGTEACYFNLAEESDFGAVLGDSFLRSGYFVYDLENNVIAIAQAAVNVTTEDITPIPSGTTIPGCTSTNTLTLAETPSITSLPPTEATQTADTSGSVLPASPTFALGAAATGGSGSSSAGSSPQNAASSLRSAGVGFAFVAGLIALVVAL